MDSRRWSSVSRAIDASSSTSSWPACTRSTSTSAPRRSSENLPAIAGLLNVWYVNFFGAQTHAVLPYSQYLHRLPAYLQQLTMESNGKSVRGDGTPVTTATGEIFWGEPETNGQHAFYQLLHQGTRLVPADFIGFAEPQHVLPVDGDTDMHDLFMAEPVRADVGALAFGRHAGGGAGRGHSMPTSCSTGSCREPTDTTILRRGLTPAVGASGSSSRSTSTSPSSRARSGSIDSFDQWGVELGKVMAKQLGPVLTDAEPDTTGLDGSTAALVRRYREWRGRSV